MPKVILWTRVTPGGGKVGPLALSVLALCCSCGLFVDVVVGMRRSGIWFGLMLVAFMLDLQRCRWGPVRQQSQSIGPPSHRSFGASAVLSMNKLGLLVLCPSLALI